MKQNPLPPSELTRPTSDARATSHFDSQYAEALERWHDTDARLRSIAGAYTDVIGPKGATHVFATELRRLSWCCQGPLDCSETLRELRSALDSIADAFEAWRALTIQE